MNSRQQKGPLATSRPLGKTSNKTVQEYLPADDKNTPTVGQYCRVMGLRLGHYNEWKRAKCPLCKKPNRTFRIRPENGAWRCFGCGNHGPGLVSLHASITGLTRVACTHELIKIARAGK